MDISDSTAPRTDQQNYDNYLTGSKTVTISEVKAGTAEQPIEIHLVEYPGQPYKPSRSMRRVLVSAWGAESSVYVGRRMTLYGDPTVRFGAAVVGGIKISHLSDIETAHTVNLTVTRGKRAPHTVEPLPPARDWASELAKAGNDLAAIEALGRDATAAGAVRDVVKIRARYVEVSKEQTA